MVGLIPMPCHKLEIRLKMNKKYKYIRTSTSKQNIGRQLEEGLVLIIDKVSGTVNFKEREGGKKLFQLLKEGDEVHISSIDRIGRDKMDMLNTLDEWKKMKVNVVVQNLGLSSIVDEKPNPIFDIVTSLLSSLAEYERNQIKERVQQGIALAKFKNKYKGRKLGSVIPRKEYLVKNQHLVKAIKKYPLLSLREIGKLTGVSHNKVRKVKGML